MPTQAIRHLRNLEHLNLNENEITTIENEAFMGLSKVKLKEGFLKIFLVHINTSLWTLLDKLRA